MAFAAASLLGVRLAALGSTNPREGLAGRTMRELEELLMAATDANDEARVRACCEAMGAHMTSASASGAVAVPPPPLPTSAAEPEDDAVAMLRTKLQEERANLLLILEIQRSEGNTEGVAALEKQIAAIDATLDAAFDAAAMHASAPTEDREAQELQEALEASEAWARAEEQARRIAREEAASAEIVRGGGGGGGAGVERRVYFGPTTVHTIPARDAVAAAPGAPVLVSAVSHMPGFGSGYVGPVGSPFAPPSIGVVARNGRLEFGTTVRPSTPAPSGFGFFPRP